jgi:hypothetical protein
MPASPTSVNVRLLVPPVACVTPHSVFDGYGWCASDVLEWRRPRDAWESTAADVTGDNPSQLAFVFCAPCTFLPRELARLHVSALAHDDEWALAPYAIDDATDELYARRVRPRDIFCLAAGHLGALAWGLHDWAHFHNHGPFEARAWTELQCDATALAWLWINRVAIGLEEGVWERVRKAFADLSHARFAAEGQAFEEATLEAQRVRSLLAG